MEEWTQKYVRFEQETPLKGTNKQNKELILHSDEIFHPKVRG